MLPLVRLVAVKRIERVPNLQLAKRGVECIADIPVESLTVVLRRN